jgi:hypothetical protein
VHVIYACADWGALANSQGQDVQRLLVTAGVETDYQISLRGKSSSDMCIVERAHELLQGHDSPDDLVLVTGDRDFRSLIETTQRRYGKRVILWGKKGTINPMVSEVADEVEWIDEFLALSQQHDLDSINRSVSRNEDAPVDPLAELAIKVEGFLRTQGWRWVSAGKLLDVLAPGQSDPETRARVRERIDRAKATGVLISESRPNPRPNPAQPTVEALSLNSAHPTVKAARLVMTRVHKRLRHALQIRKMPWVSFSYIIDGMESDTELRQAGLARSLEERTRWLDLLIGAGLVVKERRTNPENCTILWLPNVRQFNPIRVAAFAPQMAAA